MAVRAPVVLGRVHGLFGVSGWVKVFSHTRPAENLLDFPQWLLGRPGHWQAFDVRAARPHGKTLVAQLGAPEGPAIDDRDAAAALLDHEIAVPREAMPDPGPGRYYWFDLVGLEVLDRDGLSLGRVDGMMATGAHDVMVVAGEHEQLIPFVPGHFVDEVDFQAGRIVVDWNPDF